MKTGELLIYDAIGAAFNGLTPKEVADNLRALGAVDQINVRINSPGGDVFDGHAIYRQLKRHPAKKRVDVDGSACSIASVIAMAADPGKLFMSENSWLMIHAPWARFTGTAAELRDRASLLEKMGTQIVDMYADRSGMNVDDVRALYANGDAWLSAQEAVAAGLADHVTDDMAMAAHVIGDWLGEVPEVIKQRNVQIAVDAEKAKQAKIRLDNTL